MPDARKPYTVRLTDAEREAIEAQFARFEAEHPGQRATLAGVLRTLALEWVSRGRREAGR